MTRTLDRIVSSDRVSPRGMTPAEKAAYVEAFDRDGYIVIRGVVPRDQLAALHATLAAEYDRQKREGILFNGGGGLSGHLNCFPGEAARFAYEALIEHGVVDLIRAI